MTTIKTIMITACLTLAHAALTQNIDDAKDLIANERYNSAEQILEQSLDADPEAQYLLMKTYLDQDKLDQATEFAKVHLQTETMTPMNRIAYARYLFSTKKNLEALQMLMSLLEEKSVRRDAPLLINMAEVLIDADEGDAKLAISWLELA